MSIRCAIGLHNWKPQYIKLPYKVKQCTAWLFGAIEYETSTFVRGHRCSRCRKWERPPINPPAPKPVSRNATDAYKQNEKQKNEYLSSLTKGIAAKQKKAWPSINSCNCCQQRCRSNFL